MNRAVAEAEVSGAEAGLALLPSLDGHQPYHAAHADLLRRLGRDARPDYERAIALATNDADRDFLTRRLAESVEIRR